MSNKEKIAELGFKIEAMEHKFNTSVGVLIGELEKLKKEDEVKPVFPPAKHGWRIAVNENTAESIGLTTYGQPSLRAMMKRMEARAYVIEAINKANGGDNGFKSEGDNYCVVNERGRLCCDQWVGMQFAEPSYYFRTKSGCIDTLKCDMFEDAYKTMLGIK